MTAQTQSKRGVQKTSNKKMNAAGNRNMPSADQIKLFEIAIKMQKAGLSDIFIVDAVQTALAFEGVADLMNLWNEEGDKKEREEIVADIQDMIDACRQKEKSEGTYIKFNDLDAIAKNIRAFKDSLYQLVMKRGGISKLADLTAIPQPSLSRFFNSSAMPQRATVLKIAKALDLDEIKMDVMWSE